ncbi:DUF5916 domain-containing protein [Flavobacterium sp.]|uniref:DUF5916 domain-containing protein n=1 Tax=Flavobacterium sp. TaxID=239 RepID=UPI00374D1C96
MVYRFAFILIILFNINIQAQNNPTSSSENQSNSTTLEKKKLKALFTDEKISIDGELNDAIWNKAEIATDFFMFEPDNGKQISDNKKSDIKIVYDNEAIYIGAILNDDEPNKIMKEITQRDDDGSSDFFGVSLNGYNDGQQEFRFFVTAAGVQLDCNSNAQTGEDFSWDAIWTSEVKITDKGWIVEMKIPYSALRFPKGNNQTWGINFLRQIRRDRQLYFWTNVDNKKGSLEQQAGELHGIENIKTPTRLFFFPYASFYANKDKEGTKTEIKGGLDIKYGINDAFTLDAILVPDFGQTAFDNKILNLGPFEQQFSENRPFFTEGTDLFNKGSLFYSRRIGGSPSIYPETTVNEEVINYPNTVNLLNALKVSGRTKGGLGIGVLNAITEKTEVEILNTNTGLKRKSVVEPLSNYNIISFDQRFRKNSSVSFINTNVTRNGEFRDANVSGLVFDLNTKKNTYNLSGDFKYSTINEYQNQKNRNGYNTSLNFAETSGKIRYSTSLNYVTKKFDTNDLGINFQTNYLRFNGNVNYRILKPTKILNSFQLNSNIYSEYENKTGYLQGFNLNTNVNLSTKKNDGFGIGINMRPVKIYDFYQPSVEGRYVELPEYYSSWVYFSSNYNRKFALDVNPWAGFTSEKGRSEYGFDFSPRYRFNNKISTIVSYNYSKEKNTKGLADIVNDEIIFEQRDVNTSTISLRVKYALNNKMTINATNRYYWSYVENKAFEKLENNGTFSSTNYNQINNQDFSTWNLDISYSWWIAPGSQLNVLYRNNSANFNNGPSNVNKNIGDNFNSLFGDKLNQTFSISLRYFLDYNRVKNWI